MGNKNKTSGWLPAEHLRVMTFARSLGPARLDDESRKKPTASDIQEVLGMGKPAIDVSDPTINNWLKGEDRPGKKNRELIQKYLPSCAAWLKPDPNFSPISRFFCALDISGSRIESPVRKLETKSTHITVGKCLSILSKRWGCVQVVDGNGGFAIPRLRRLCPRRIPATIYVSNNPLTLMDFMFRCGAHLELSEAELTEWAIDLASLTLLVEAFFEGATLAERRQNETTSNYSQLTYRIFFRGRDEWPNLGDVADELNNFSEFDVTEICYPQRLMQARQALSSELLYIGSDLSIAKRIFRSIEDRGKMSQKPIGALVRTFRQSDLLGENPKILRMASGKYRYEFRQLTNAKRIVLCHDLILGTVVPLPERPELFNEYPGTLSWGYSGSSPLFLAISMLAHHLGDDDFGDDEIDRLMDKWISRLPERLIETSFFLTTEQIDKCLNQ